MIPRASSSSSTELQSRYITASSISDRSNVIMAYLEHKREDALGISLGLVAKYHQDDIYTCDVTELAFRMSPMADGVSTSLFKVVLTFNTYCTEQLKPQLVCSEEMDDIKSTVQSSHARTRDTCVVSSLHTAHSNTVINHLLSF